MISFSEIPYGTASHELTQKYLQIDKAIHNTQYLYAQRVSNWCVFKCSSHIPIYALTLSPYLSVAWGAPYFTTLPFSQLCGLLNHLLLAAFHMCYFSAAEL